VAIGSLEANLGHDVVAIDDLELAIRVAPGYEPATSELATLKRHRGE
jgi:hypothetical protein